MLKAQGILEEGNPPRPKTMVVLNVKLNSAYEPVAFVAYRLVQFGRLLSRPPLAPSE